MRIVQNNYGRWCQRKTTQFRLENGNSEPQMWDKHGHVVISAAVSVMGPLQLAVTWYKIRHAGEQAVHWDIQNKATSSR